MLIKMGFYLFIVWIHVLAAFLWIGGMLFIAFVLAPISRKIEPLTLRANILKEIGTRFRLIGWICIIILLITGVLNIFNKGMSHTIFLPSQLFGTEFGRILALKLTFIFLMITLSIIHDFFLGPRLTALMQSIKQNNSSLAVSKVTLSELQKLRWQVSWLARINTIFGIVIIFLAINLAR